MTKRILAMLLVVTLVVGLLPMNVFAGPADDRTKYTAPLAEHDSAAHICEHCVVADANTATPPAEGWIAWGDDPSEVNLPTAKGHYYLTRHMDVQKVDLTKDVVLCLNGKTVTASGTENNAADRFYYLKDAGTLTIVDCTAKTEKVNGEDVYTAGKLTGATSSAIMTYDAAANRSTGSVNIYDGIFEGNSRGSAGGALAIQGRTKLNIYGGRFVGNTAGYGGAIYLNSNNNAAHLEDVVFTGNVGNNGAGAICAKGPLTLKNVTVRNNTTKGSNAAQGKGAISLCRTDAQTVTLQGNVVITDNTDGAATPAKRNLYLRNATQRVAVSGLVNTASIGLTLEAGMGTFAEGVTEADAKDRFTPDTAGLYVHEQSGLLILSDTVPEPPHSHHACGNTTCSDTTHTDVVFDKWGDDPAEKTSLPTTGGNYYLVADINLDAVKVINGDLNLCLHGHTITAKSGVRHMGISNGVTVTITDCGANGGNIGAITGGDNDYGGSVNVNAGATLNLYNGSFVNNQAKTAGAAGQGGAIYLQGTKNNLPGGVFNMYGGQLGAEGKPNKAYNGAAVYVAKGGTFNMQGGSIAYNEATNSGAAIYTADIADVDIANAKINNNTATANGGAIYLANANSALDVVNTRFEKNSTQKNGGVLYTEKACTVSFENCTFNENHADSGEGGVAYLKTAKTTFTGGIMERNTAKNGSALVVFGGTCELDGVKIKNNGTANSFGAVHMNRIDGKLSITIKGATEICGNTTAAGAAQNLYMRNNASYINMAGLTEGANICVTMEDTRMRSGYWNISADTVTEEQASWIHSDNSDYSVKLRDGKAYLTNGHDHKICIGSTCSDAGHGDVTWYKWTDTTKLPTAAGNYYLADDVQLTDVQYIRSDVNLCLNGKTVTAKDGARLISVQKYDSGTVYHGMLEITDCKGTGALTGGNSTFGGAFNVQAGATLNLYGGNITGNQSDPENSGNGFGGAIYLQRKTTRYPVGDKRYTKDEAKKNNVDITNITGENVPGGVFNMYGGTISDNKAYDGAAVHGQGGALINVLGGTISNNAATNFGGAICAKEGITVNMEHVTIAGNTAKTNGGAVYVTGGNSVLNITGATFTGNTATNGGAVLAQSTGTVVTVTDSDFSGNDATSGGAMYISKNTTLNISGGKFTGNTADNGAALYTAAASTTLEDVEITGNTSAYNGAVYMNADAETLTLKGQAKILGNMAKGRANNLYLTGDELVSMDTLAEKARIGVSVEKYDRVISAQNDTDFSKNFVSDSPYRVISYKDKALYLANSTEHTHCTCAGAAASGCEHGSIVWLAWEESNTLPTKDGNYYLTKDVVMTNQIWVQNKNITICLNGHTVTAAKGKRFISVQEGTVLNITDCRGSGKLTGGNSTFGGAVNVNAGGTLNLFGGTFTGNQSNDTTPLPEKVDLMKGQGGAIYLQAGKNGLPGGVLNMYGGTIRGNKASLGGGIYGAATTSLNIYGGTISSNKAVKYGGGTYSTGGITTNIANAKFEGNTAGTGGAVYVSGSGSKLNVKNTTFHKNTAQNAAGAILAQSKGTVIDINGCTFTANKSIGSGGAVYASSNTTLKLDNSIFTGNIAEQGASLYALRATSTVGKVTMEGNKAATTKAKPTLRAAGIYVSGGEMTIDGAVIKNNQGGSGTAITTGVAKATVDGEQVSFHPTINFVSGMISGNKGTSGGAILLQSKTVFNMKGGKISGNSASDGGAMYVSTNATFNMFGGTISGNTAKNNGGGIYALRSNVNLKSGTVSDNTAVKMGGAIFLSGAKLYQSGAYISGNKTGTGTGGGAIATGIKRDGDNKYEPYIKISGGTITDNYGKHGGGILLQGSTKTVLDMTGGKIVNNQCKADGGAIYASTSTTLNMTGGTITGNTSDGRSGAIHHNNSTGSYTGVEMFDNSAKTSGGAMVITGVKAQVKMKNVKLYDNSAATGGTIVNQGKGKLTLEKVEIYNSTSSGSGGAIYISTNSYLDVIDSNIHDCQAKNFGGALYFANHTHANVDGLTLQNNVSKTEGGGIYTRGATSFFRNMKLIGNKADSNGGGFYAAYPALQGVTGMIVKPDFKTGNVMENVEFLDNQAAGQAGGLYIHKGNFVTVKNGIFTGNSSGVEGAAVYAQGDFTMNGLTATGNTSKMDGYAVFLADVEYDDHSYTSGLNQMAGNVIVKDNQGGDMYLGETTTIAVLAEGIGENTEIHVTLASGLLTNKVQGAYHYEGGNQVYVITYGDRSLTEPEYDEALAQQGKEEKGGDAVLYVGVGVFVLAIAAVVVVLVLKKKKKAPAAEAASE